VTESRAEKKILYIEYQLVATNEGSSLSITCDEIPLKFQVSVKERMVVAHTCCVGAATQHVFSLS